eukprot:m.87598 g.87598  ORF g.87598 m.87598 type:complete len:78 (-) comp8327_c0_seq2:130-363(-)
MCDHGQDQGLLIAVVTETGQLCLRPDGTVSLPAAAALHGQTFTGLQMRVGETPVTMAVEGTVGTSTGYSHEAGFDKP